MRPSIASSEHSSMFQTTSWPNPMSAIAICNSIATKTRSKRSNAASRYDPMMPAAMPDWGRAYSCLSRCRESVDSFNRAFRINPNQEKEGSNVLLLASAYAGLSDYETSAKFYSDAAALLPNNADAHHGLGWALRSMGRSKEAEAPLITAIRLTPDDEESHYELGRIHFDLGRLPEAEAEN